MWAPMMVTIEKNGELCGPFLCWKYVHMLCSDIQKQINVSTFLISTKYTNAEQCGPHDDEKLQRYSI